MLSALFCWQRLRFPFHGGCWYPCCLCLFQTNFYLFQNMRRKSPKLKNGKITLWKHRSSKPFCQERAGLQRRKGLVVWAKCFQAFHRSSFQWVKSRWQQRARKSRAESSCTPALCFFEITQLTGITWFFLSSCFVGVSFSVSFYLHFSNVPLCLHPSHTRHLFFCHSLCLHEL